MGVTHVKPWNLIAFLLKDRGTVYVPVEYGTTHQLRDALTRAGVTVLSVYPYKQGSVVSPFKSTVVPVTPVGEVIHVEYPKYLDGKTYRLHYGIHYTCKVSRVYQKLHDHAFKRGLKLYASYNSLVGYIEFCVKEK